MINYRKMLEKRWSQKLTQTQRNAWNVYAQFCPGTNSVSLDNELTGKEIFVLCNTPNRK